MNSATIHIYPPNVLCYSGQAVDWSEKQGSLLSLLPLELEENPSQRKQLSELD